MSKEKKTISVLSWLNLVRVQELLSDNGQNLYLHEKGEKTIKHDLDGFLSSKAKFVV